MKIKRLKTFSKLYTCVIYFVTFIYTFSILVHGITPIAASTPSVRVPRSEKDGAVRANKSKNAKANPVTSEGVIDFQFNSILELQGVTSELLQNPR